MNTNFSNTTMEFSVGVRGSVVKLRKAVLITGGSQGLGHAFAKALAQQGRNLILIARDADRLERVKIEIEKLYRVNVETLAADLSTEDAVRNLQSEIARREIRIEMLINNAGIGYWGLANSQEPDCQLQMVRLNCIALVALCRAFERDLEAERGSIINVASIAAFQPVPYMAVYAATKAFVKSFSEALHWELKEKNIFVQTLLPGVILTDFNERVGFDVKKMKGAMTPEAVARLSLESLKRRAITVVAGRNTVVQQIFGSCFPRTVVLRKVADIFRPAT